MAGGMDGQEAMGAPPSADAIEAQARAVIARLPAAFRAHLGDVVVFPSICRPVFTVPEMVAIERRHRPGWPVPVPVPVPVKMNNAGEQATEVS